MHEKLAPAVGFVKHPDKHALFYRAKRGRGIRTVRLSTQSVTLTQRAENACGIRLECRFHPH